jgi:hypothetical protein
MKPFDKLAGHRLGVSMPETSTAFVVIAIRKPANITTWPHK